MTDSPEVQAKKAALKDHFIAMLDGPRVREDSLDAMLSLFDNAHGTLVVKMPKGIGRPIDALVMTGGLRVKLSDEKEI